ncbi:MAG: 2-C-methyl-D-erythritol 4-phosphate cytidylyltransferase [Neisseria sp.]|nr:2-C-methyl-D-erythritol 4-phosphate cytidylyltransferase [Neisseria sp.]
MSKRKIALIPAAGVGSRFGSNMPKQYIEIAGQTVLSHTVNIFLNNAEIDLIAIVVSPEDNQVQTALSKPLHPKVVILPCGGETRAESVRNGVDALLNQQLAAETDWILVHDAARCCLPPAVLQRLLNESTQNETEQTGAILAIPVADTLKRATGEHIAQTVSRQDLWQAQTPQMFAAHLLQTALNGDLNDITDEASAVEKLGIAPKLVLGDVRNIKLTQAQDADLVRLLLNEATKLQTATHH